jgi:hypothetical protein
MGPEQGKSSGRIATFCHSLNPYLPKLLFKIFNDVVSVHGVVREVLHYPGGVMFIGT